MPGRCVMIPTDEPAVAPLFHFISRMLGSAGHDVSVSDDDGALDGAVLAVGFGPACRSAASLPGVWLSPDFTDEATLLALGSSKGPGLVVGTFVDPGWDRAAAARVRQFEVLQLPHVDRFFEVPGDPVASLHVYERILERVAALVRKIR